MWKTASLFLEEISMPTLVLRNSVPKNCEWTSFDLKSSYLLQSDKSSPESRSAINDLFFNERLSNFHKEFRCHKKLELF